MRLKKMDYSTFFGLLLFFCNLYVLTCINIYVQYSNKQEKLTAQDVESTLHLKEEGLHMSHMVLSKVVPRWDNLFSPNDSSVYSIHVYYYISSLLV